MALSRSKQTIQKDPPRVGIDLDYIDGMVKIIKGHGYDERANIFYGMFLNKPLPLGPDPSIDTIREDFQNAWWIEEEDIKQECYLFSYCKGHNIDYWAQASYLFLYLRDWILKMRVFPRLHNSAERIVLEETETTYELPPPQIDLRILFNKHPFFNFKDLSLYHRYMIYCFSQGHNICDIAELTGQHRPFVHKEVDELRSVMESYYEYFR